MFRGDLYTIAALDGQTRAHLMQLIVEETARMRACTVLCLGHNRGWEECASSFAVRCTPPCGALLPGSYSEIDCHVSQGRPPLLHTKSSVHLSASERMLLRDA